MISTYSENVGYVWLFEFSSMKMWQASFTYIHKIYTSIISTVFHELTSEQIVS